jgi:hypothetical protein
MQDLLNHHLYRLVHPIAAVVAVVVVAAAAAAAETKARARARIRTDMPLRHSLKINLLLLYIDVFDVVQDLQPTMRCVMI